MLNFNKKGLICSYQTLDIPWYKKNTMVPITYLIDDKTLRIFLGMCDSDNVGRIGYIDVNPDNPSEILDYSRSPCLDIGKDGCFDDNGVLPSSILQEDGKLYMFYSAYQKQNKIPYTIFSGCAVSYDSGKNFSRISDIPFLDRRNNERFVRAAPCIVKKDNVFQVWYSSADIFINRGEKIVPNQRISFLEIENLFNANHSSEINIAKIEFNAKDEIGTTMPKIFEENGIYKMIYSIRSISKGYRMGYAESYDNGKNWQRMDDKIKIDVSIDGWDSEMICFGHMQSYKNKTYLFYCGNHYGMGGMGYAELIK